MSISHLDGISSEHTIFLSLGANMGDRKNNLEQALQYLKNLMIIQALSSLYETEPLGEGGKPLYQVQEGDQQHEAGYLHLEEGKPLPYFLNLVCQGTTKLEPDKLLAELKNIEDVMGRLPSFRNAPRPIDIDILLYDDLQVTLPQLIIPHPRMRERAFVLLPLAEIAPSTIDPVSGQTIQQLSTSVSNQSIRKVDTINNL